VGRLRGVAFVVGVAIAALGVARFREAHEVRLDAYDAFNLPGFDAHVYLAMAEEPAIFTLPPWGFRLLVPWLVHVLPGEPVVAWRWLGYLALSAGGGLVFLFLRRLGCGTRSAWLAVAAYALSAPVDSAVAYPFLVEPVTLCLLLALLLGIEAGAGAGVLSLVAVLLVLSKEATLFFLPVIFFARRDRDGTRRALATSLAAAVPALLVTAVLRLWWAPVPLAPGTAPAGVVWLALFRLLERFPDWWRWALLGGLTPLAALGALTPTGRGWLRRYGYLLAASWGLAFAASVYTAEPSVPFFGEDIPRLLLYAMPVMLALGLAALDWVVPHLSVPPPGAAPATVLALGGTALALATAVLPFALQDGYRRADLRGPRDGRYVLTFCRESLSMARLVAAGRAVDLAPERRSFIPGKSFPELAGQMRWFLRQGFGPQPHYGSGPVVTDAKQASLVLPCLSAQDLNLNIVASAASPRRVAVLVNGSSVGDMQLADELSRQRFVLPGGQLLRGDNELRLVSDRPGVRLHELWVRAAR
jgi:hypothetical protein